MIHRTFLLFDAQSGKLPSCLVRDQHVYLLKIVINLT